MKKENGVTLLKICIFILIFFISIIIITKIIIDTNKMQNLKRYVSEMQKIQEEVNLIRENYKIWEDYNPNETGNYYSYIQSLGFSNANSMSNLYIEEFEEIIKHLNEKQLKYWDKNIDSILTNYFYFTPENLEKNFEIKNDKLYVIINFYTGNIISKDGIEDINKNEIIFRQYDSSVGNELKISEVYFSEIIPKIEIVKNKGLSQKIKISLPKNENNISDIKEVYYYTGIADEVQKKASNLNDFEYVKDENSVYFTIQTSGEYQFIVEDSNSTQYPTIMKNFNLCNPPLLIDGMTGIYWVGDEERKIEDVTDCNWYDYNEEDKKMANAKTKDGNYWVWVPRFLYRERGENVDVEFVFETSNTATSGKNLTGYKIQEAFSENGEKSGFWISKFQSNNEKMLAVSPGETLAVVTSKEAKQIGNEYLNNSQIYSSIMSYDQLNSIILISKSVKNKITNNPIYYAGGAADEFAYIENTQYSSSNNVYGIYDLFTSENELLRDSNVNEEGRYRVTLNLK